jgi:RimJ/RimL family protein N-acetyltransferase
MTDWQTGEALRFETERFYLRTFTPEDINETYLSWWNDAEIQKSFGNQPCNWKLDDALEHMKSFDNLNRFHLGIFVKESDRLIGFYSFIINPDENSSESSVCIGEKDWRHQGVISEVAPYILDYRFNKMGHYLIVGKIVGDNPVIKKLYKKFGFKLVKTKPHKNLQQDGRPVETSYFMLTREEWQRRQKDK